MVLYGHNGHFNRVIHKITSLTHTSLSIVHKSYIIIILVVNVSSVFPFNINLTTITYVHKVIYIDYFLVSFIFILSTTLFVIH